MIRPRVLLATGLALLSLAGLTGAVLRATYGERPAYVHVRWRPGVDPEARRDIERAHRLIPVAFRGDRTWAYLLSDLSGDNISSLLHDAAVEDTHHVERGQARVASTAPRGDYLTDRPAWIARALELVRGALLGAGALALAAGLFTAWRYSRRYVAAALRAATLQLARGGSRAAWSLVFGGSIATLVVLLGTRDQESFETAFFSLDRGTATAVVRVLGQPVYTTAVGLGVRLPLHGSLGASPAAALAPYLSDPLTYWLLLGFSIAASAMVVRHALEPICGPVASWVALVLLFLSVPTVNYTLYDDWPETAVTYCAFVACVFAPQALVASLGTPGSPRLQRIAAFSAIATCWSLIALSHPGYWPLLAGTLVLASVLALFRPEHPFRTKLAAIAALGIASLLAVAPQAPDILRELTGGGMLDTSQMERFAPGTQGSLMQANAFPWEPPGARLPFTYLALALLSFPIGLISNSPLLRRLVVGGALISVALGVGAATLEPTGWRYAPSNTWALRDPAIAFAVLSGASAAAAARRSPAVHVVMGARLPLAALLLAAMQGLAYAGHLVATEWREKGQRAPWTQDMTRLEDRLRQRGWASDRLPSGRRLAFWPGLRDVMRNRQRGSVDFADAGYLVVTASTKDRTMRGLVEPNEFLFNQTTDLPPEVLCNTEAVQFLQLQYLVAPLGTECRPWKRVRDVRLDGLIEVSIATEPDSRAWALPLSRITDPIVRQPAFSAASSLTSSLTPLPGTSVTLMPAGVGIQLDDPARARGHTLVLPLAYDSALRASSGRVHNVGGLAALIDVDQRQVTVEFVPDLTAVLRAASMTLAQLLAVIGFVGMARVSWAAAGDTPKWSMAWARAAASRAGGTMRRLLHRRNWLYLAFSLAVVFGGNIAGALLALTVFIVIRLARQMSWYRWIGRMLFAAALVSVAAAGSQAASAVHDPLFWSLVAAITFTMSAVIRRWPVAAATASACAGAVTVLATLLLLSPDIQSMFSDVDIATIGQSFVRFSDRFGVLATTLLLGLWLQGIWPRGRSGWKLERTEAAVRGALLAGLMITLTGATPAAGMEGAWGIALGVLLGLAEASARNRDTR
jgi:hypothetical protein